MPQGLTSIALPSLPCKCCGGKSPIFGVVDFNKNCEDRRKRVLDPCGIPIYYHRCAACGFLFTAAFDGFSREDFSHWIYNAEYAVVDPEYADLRPRRNASLLAQMFGNSKQIRVLDHGGGNGKLAALLRAMGFSSVDSYDPFVEAFASKPAGRYDLIVSSEVAEHTPRPAETFAEMDQLMEPKGMVLFSTQLQPAEIIKMGVGWWYVAPRNGHVSMYTRAALEKLVRPLGLGLGSFNDDTHVLCREVPAFAKQLFKSK
jgi:hypothetical protein